MIKLKFNQEIISAVSKIPTKSNILLEGRFYVFILYPGNYTLNWDKNKIMIDVSERQVTKVFADFHSKIILMEEELY